MNEMNSGKEHRESESLDDLLNFLVCNRSLDGLRLGEIRDLQAEVYEQTRNKLVRLFRWRGSVTPEELVDITFDRVNRRLPDLRSFVGDPSHYVCGVARLVFLESLRRRNMPIPPPEVSEDEKDEDALSCLDDCMEQLRPVERELILDYYRGEGRTKIDHREFLAQQLGTTVNALRIQTCRIRRRLRTCVTNCLEQK